MGDGSTRAWKGWDLLKLTTWILGALLLSWSAFGQDAHSLAYRGSVAPFLEKNCVGCHSGKAKAGGLSLADPGLPPAVWE